LDQAFATLFEQLTQGGPEAVISAMILFIIMLLWERKRLLDQLAKKDEKIDKIIDDYHSGNITLADALNSLKLVLYEIKGKL
jgi:K+ transporter